MAVGNLLTYSATTRTLFKAVETGRLVLREPLRPLPMVRKMYLTPEVAKVLDGEDDKFKHLPTKETEVILGRFSAGHLVTVSMIGDNSKKPDFEKLSDLDEVWAVCARRPRMFQVRIFGRFIDKGIFIGTALHERRTLGIRQQYADLAAKVPDQWNAVLGDCVAFSANSALEYFGGICRDVDEQA